MLRQLGDVIAFLDDASDAVRDAKTELHDTDALVDTEAAIGNARETVNKCLRFMAKRDWLNARGTVHELQQTQHKLSRHQIVRRIDDSGVDATRDAAAALQTPSSTNSRSISASRLILFVVGAVLGGLAVNQMLGAQSKVKHH